MNDDWAGDSRVRGWFLMSSPYPTIACSAFYFYAVKAGVTYMRKRPAFELRSCLIAYNCFLVMLSSWIFMEGGRSGWFGHYSYRCAECDMEDNEVNQRMVNIVHVYYISKFIEMMDTLFFVLRKKNELLTPLHLIHHGLLPISCWFTVKYVPGQFLVSLCTFVNLLFDLAVGHATFMGFVNSFVHIVMYSYYALAAAGARGRVVTWLKKSTTKIQMIQFVLMIVHSLQILFNGCNFPKWTAYSNAGHGLLFLALFANFYRHRYSGTVQKNVDVVGNKERSMRLHGA